MRKTIDLTGQRFGRLTVIERIESKRNYAMWKCLCDCGNYTDSRTGVLLKGRKLSCGCLQKEIASKNQFIDISGERFGNLTAIEPIGKTKHNEIIWKCQCDCGKQTEATGINLRRGHAKSCGCLKGGFASKGKKKSNLGGKYHIPLPTLRKWEQGKREPPDYLVELLEFKVRKDMEESQ